MAQGSRARWVVIGVAVMVGATAAAVWLPGLLTPTVLEAQPSDSGSEPVVQLDFADQVGRVLGDGAAVEVSGSASARLEAHVVGRGDGRVVTVQGRAGNGAAVSFSRDDADDSVAVVVVPRSGDDLTMGTRDFTFGADFNSDGNWADGNNVVERGIYSDRGQYKFEIDEGRPGCVVRGDAGQVVARLGPILAPGVWYSGQCVRKGSAVTVTVRELDGASPKEWARTVEGPIGDVQPESPTTQLSIGAKTWDNVKVGVENDQFTGVIDNVYVRLDA
ncbi:hypothetical protein [Propionicimonas sp.]|uniref:hypothetical protein n=1 Tax=Propionicimonas sp. TaxID=1955623 RepID=UPI0039E5DEB3